MKAELLIEGSPWEQWAEQAASDPNHRALRQLFEDTGYLGEGDAWIEVDPVGMNKSGDIVFCVMSELDDVEEVAFTKIYVSLNLGKGDMEVDYGGAPEQSFSFDDIAEMEGGMDEVDARYSAWVSEQ